MEKYLTEAFQALSILDEDVFNVTKDGIEELKDFTDENDKVQVTDELTVIDPLAETEEDLQDSYVGKVILDCSICQSKIYKNADEVVINEETNLANVGEVCPYCQSSDGYKIIGQVAEYCPECNDKEESEDASESTDEVKVETDANVEEKPTEDEDLDESVKAKKSNTSNWDKIKRALNKESMREDFNKVDIETDTQKMSMEAQEDGKVTVTTEPKKEEESNEVVAPIEDDVKAEFKTEENPEEDSEDQYSDVDIDEIDEEEFDDLGESYLKRVYENVKSYKTVSGSTKGNQIKLEGIITFKSGKQAKTNFIFEAKSITKSGKLKFTGLNEQFAKGKKTYTLTGKADKGKLVCESLTYNYRARDPKANASKRLYGTVTRK